MATSAAPVHSVPNSNRSGLCFYGPPEGGVKHRERRLPFVAVDGNMCWGEVADLAEGFSRNNALTSRTVLKESHGHANAEMRMTPEKLYIRPSEVE